MPNPAVAFGLRPVRHAQGAPVSGAFREYTIPASDATAVFIGDLVTGVGTSSTVGGLLYQDVTRSATGDVFQGVVVGVAPVDQTSLPYRAASTLRVVRVCDDPHQLFEIKEASTGTALTAADVGLNINISVVAGSTVTGFSGTVADNTTEATTNTLDLKIVEIKNSPDNDVGFVSQSLLVRLNRHRFVNQTAGV